MTTGQDEPKRWSSRTIEIKVWKILAALVILPILVHDAVERLIPIAAKLRSRRRATERR